MVSVPLTMSFAVASMVVGELVSPCQAACQAAADLSEDANKEAAYTQALRHCRGICLRIQRIVRDLSATNTSCAKQLTDFIKTSLEKIMAKKKVTLDLRWCLPLLQAVPAQLTALGDLITGILVMASLEVQFKVLDYKVASQEWLAWQKAGCKGPAPYLWHVTEFSAKSHSLRQPETTIKPFEKHDSYDFYGDPFLVNDGLDDVLRCFTNSPLPEQAMQRHCESKVTENVAGFVEALSLEKLALCSQDHMVGKSAAQIFSSIFAGGIPADSPLDVSVKSIQFKAGTQTALDHLPHLVMHAAVRSLVDRIDCRNVVLECLQQLDETTVALDVDHLRFLLEVHAGVHTVLVLAARVNESVTNFMKVPFGETTQALKALAEHSAILKALLSSDLGQTCYANAVSTSKKLHVYKN